jgi:guanylate kinase
MVAVKSNKRYITFLVPLLLVFIKLFGDVFMTRKGNLFVVSAPSGAGKTTLCNLVLKEKKNIAYSISYTTRQPRVGEKNGREYFFVKKEVFKEMIKNNAFAEWAKVHENYYGTSKKKLESLIKKGKDVLLDIDVHGGINIKKNFPQTCMIFIMAPDIKTLRKRLILRNKEPIEVIEKRIENSKSELNVVNKYDFLIINKNLKEAAKILKSIIEIYRCKIEKNKKYF